MRLLIGSVLVGAAACFSLATAAQDDGLVVHEWGTFTSFQDDQGKTIGGINVDDEPVPAFVHRLKDLPIFTTRAYPAAWSQGAPRCHPGVTLRLETPVLYFYPPSRFAHDTVIDVEASFAGGWLTEFYPFATAETPKFPHELLSTTQGKLRWSGLRLAATNEAALAETTAPVWLAPRKVASAVVAAPGGETEKYLFYRGVGHLDAPLTVRQDGKQVTVTLREPGLRLTQLPQSWLVRVLPDGKIWYRTLRPDDARNGSIVVSLPTDTVADDQFATLRRELAGALTAVGLFADEAQAMLETWRLSYFESEGLRLFFLLPQTWTDAQLPLSVSIPSHTTRVMMGRVELISAYQRGALDQLYGLADEALDVAPLYLDVLANHRYGAPAQWSEQQRAALERWRARLSSHAQFYQEFGLEVPRALQLYDSLGRFRDALLAHELATARDESVRTRIGQVMKRFSACEVQKE